MKDVEDLLNDTSIRLESIGSNKTIRKWVISELRYDYEWDGYCVGNLLPNEQVEFGTPTAAYRYAKNLIRKYRKIHSDAVIVIKEKAVQ